MVTVVKGSSFSTPENKIAHTYASVSEMKSLVTPVLSLGETLQTQSYLDGWEVSVNGPTGGAIYTVVTKAQHDIVRDKGVVDEFGDHTLSDGNIALMRFDREMSVDQFGAIADGAITTNDGTDNQLPIQAAIDAMPFNAILRLNYGVYNISGGLSINKGINITGTGTRKYWAATFDNKSIGSIIRTTSLTETVITVSPPDAQSQIFSIILRDFMVKGQLDNPSAISGSGLAFDGRDQLGTAIYIDIDNVCTAECKYWGIFIQGSVFDYRISRTFALQCGRNGIFINDTASLFSIGEGSLNDVSIFECGFEFAGSPLSDLAAGLYLQGGRGNSLNGISSTNSAGSGIKIVGENISGGSWSCESNAEGAPAILFTGGVGNNVVNGATVDGITIDYITGATNNGIQCSSSASNVTCTGVQFSDITLGNDIAFDANCNNNVVAGYRQSNTFLVDAPYRWVLSTTGTNNYYLILVGGADPGFPSASALLENGEYISEISGGPLTPGTFMSGDFDTLGFSTIYIRLGDDSDPDSKPLGYVRLIGGIRDLGNDNIIQRGGKIFGAGITTHEVSSTDAFGARGAQYSTYVPNRGGSAGEVLFHANNDQNNKYLYSKIEGEGVTGGPGSEGGALALYASSGGTLIDMIRVGKNGITYKNGQISDDSSNPSIQGAVIINLQNTIATTIADFANASNWQELILYATNSNTTIQHSAAINLKTGANVLMNTNDTMRLIRTDTLWLEV